MYFPPLCEIIVRTQWGHPDRSIEKCNHELWDTICKGGNTSILKESNKIKKITKLNQLANKQTHQTRNKQTKETYSNQKCKKFTNATNAGNKQTNQQVNNLYATQCNYFNMSECTHVRRHPCSFQSIVT